MKSLLKNAVIFALCWVPAGDLQAFYQGSGDWHPPKLLTCMGLPHYPNGRRIDTRGQVLGQSTDTYVFTDMEGVLGVWWFELDKNPSGDKSLHGTATYIDAIDWTHDEYDVTCKIIK